MLVKTIIIHAQIAFLLPQTHRHLFRQYWDLAKPGAPGFQIAAAGEQIHQEAERRPQEGVVKSVHATRRLNPAKAVEREEEVLRQKRGRLSDGAAKRLQEMPDL